LGLYHRLHQKIEKRWWQAKKPWLMTAALACFYHQINQYNLQRRLQRQIVPKIPLISVGNITVGGSGKTPFVIWLSQQLIQLGYTPVIICRGDGGYSRNIRHVQTTDSAFEVGDEAKMLAQQCQCPVIRGRDRVQASVMAASLGNVMILDDGFQYRQLKASVDIVLVPHMGIGNACILPAGPMREPVSALKRTDLVIRTGAQGASPMLSDKKEWWLQFQSSGLQDVQTTQNAAPKQVIALTSIARPQRFVESLTRYGIQVVEHSFFPDHHTFDFKDIQDVLTTNIAVAVTAKDAVKLLEIWPKDKALWVLRQAIQCEQGLMEKIQEHMLRAKKEMYHVG